MRLRKLLVVDLLLLVASLPGLFNVLAKDRASTTEGVIAWVSALALVAALVGLVIIAIVAALRLANRSARPS